MVRGSKLYFIHNGVIMKGEYYKRENGLYIIQKETTKGKYSKMYKIKPECIATRISQ